MARTYVQPGSILTFIAPTGGVVAGVPVFIGGILVVPQNTAAQTLPFEGMIDAVHNLPKTSAQAWTTVGQKIYWNTSTSKLDSDSTTGPLVGIAAATAANPSGTGAVRLNATAQSLTEGGQGVLAVLVDNSGGAAADGTIAAVTDNATAAAAVKELATKVNAIITALQGVGIVTAS